MYTDIAPIISLATIRATEVLTLNIEQIAI